MTREHWLKTTALLSAGALLPANLRAALAANNELKRVDFGPDFIWATATAAFQIEGAWNEDGKGESIWDHYAHYTHKIKHHQNADVADDFYHRYAGDIELMHQMHIPAYRFSISWPRLLPYGAGAVNQKGIDFYNRVIDKCLQQNITPWVTCYHWDLPQVLQAKGGWLNRDVLYWFEEFVTLCGKNFGDRVKNWMVFNEPVSFVLNGYLLGADAPGITSFAKFYKAAHHVVMGHGVGGRALRSIVKDANIGSTFWLAPVDGFKNTVANNKAALRMDTLINRLFIEPVLGMGYPVKDLPALKHVEKHMLPGDAEKMKFDFDFIGVQNYMRLVAKDFALMPALHALQVDAKKLSGNLTALHWEVYPEGMYRIIKQIAAYPGVKKIIVTENGAAFNDVITNGEINDTQRLQFIKDYLQQILKAKHGGANVCGYFIWTFLDNFEWSEGFTPRFGLVGVDYKTQQRTVKASGKWFAEFLKGD